MGEENFRNLVKLVNDFDGFESFRELNAIIYLNSKIEKKFKYDYKNFVFHSEKGGDNKEIEWDVISLELSDILTTKASVKITEKGKRILEEDAPEVDFEKFRNYLLSLDRELWPAAAMYLYTTDYYSHDPLDFQKEKAHTTLCKYGFSQNEIGKVETFLQK